MNKQNHMEKTGSLAMSKDERHLVIVSSSSSAADTLRADLFPGADIEDVSGISGAVQYRDPAQGLVITDLSGGSHRSLNLALLSARADIVLIIADAALGLEKKSLWVKALASLAAVPHLVMAADNMSFAGYSQERFEELRDEFTAKAAAGYDCRKVSIIPVDAALDDNIHEETANMPWYDGPALLPLLCSAKAPGADIAAGAALQSSDQFAVHLCWAGQAPMLPGRHYHVRRGDQRAEAHISTLKHRINPETMDNRAAKSLFPGDIGYCNISLDNPVSFTPFDEGRDNGSLEFFDEESGEMVAFGLIKHGLRRATNVKWQALEIDKASRAASKRQTPCVLWFTGLSGSGKTTVASLVEKKLHAREKHTYVLDGDNVRHGLCRDLGFTDADRVENLRRISETTKLFVDAGLIVLVSFISPFVSERRAAREMFADGEFLEIYMQTPLEICEQRDPKGLYRKVREGKLKNFTGIDSPYEPPQNAEINLPGQNTSPELLADMVIAEMEERGLI